MTLFVDSNSKVDREALREYANKKLTGYAQQVSFMLTARQHKDFWEGLHRGIVAYEGDEKKQLMDVEAQVKHLPDFIEGWIRMSVESGERFKFFVKAKAEELASGDETRDYFWALQIRHDQLIGLMRVVEQLIEHMNRWLSMSVEDVLDDGVFWGLAEQSVEKQIYLEAEAVKAERDKLV